MIFYESFEMTNGVSCPCDYDCPDSPTCQSCDD